MLSSWAASKLSSACFPQLQGAEVTMFVTMLLPELCYLGWNWNKRSMQETCLGSQHLTQFSEEADMFQQVPPPVHVIGPLHVHSMHFRLISTHLPMTNWHSYIPPPKSPQLRRIWIWVGSEVRMSVDGKLDSVWLFLAWAQIRRDERSDVHCYHKDTCTYVQQTQLRSVWIYSIYRRSGWSTWILQGKQRRSSVTLSLTCQLSKLLNERKQNYMNPGCPRCQKTSPLHMMHWRIEWQKFSECHTLGIVKSVKVARMITAHLHHWDFCWSVFNNPWTDCTSPARWFWPQTRLFLCRSKRISVI